MSAFSSGFACPIFPCFFASLSGFQSGDPWAPVASRGFRFGSDFAPQEVEAARAMLEKSSAVLAAKKEETRSEPGAVGSVGGPGWSEGPENGAVFLFGTWCPFFGWSFLGVSVPWRFTNRGLGL